ncbi:MAG: hypothetical protein ACPGLV_12985 [Bacteroidia bacterium]
MKLYFISIALLVFGLIGCGNDKGQVDHKNDQSSDSVACAVDTNEAKQINPNGETELALLMRQMDSDLNAAKTAMRAGNLPNYNFVHNAIKTAEPTKKHIKGDPVFASFADVYINSIKAANNAEIDSIPAMHNKIIMNCIECHKSYCTGPIDRIRKLRINPEKVSFKKG